jgi:hypothetical protein
MATYVKYVKTSSDPTVYGVTSTGQYVPFSSWNELLSANGGQAPNIQTVSNIPSSTSTAPTTTSTTPAAAPAPTSSGGSGGSFTQYVKTANSPTVYGRTSDGRWVAFETGDQFTGSGGQWNQISIVPSAPTGAMNYSQWRAAPAPTSVSTTNSATGDPNLDSLLGRLDQMIQDQATQGNRFNPNIELTPDVVRQFLDQATAEIGPYYGGQINAIRDQLNTSLSNLQQKYDLSKEGQLASFQQNLNQTRENLAAGGAAQSGFRGQQEQQLQQGMDRSLTGLGLDTAQAANNLVNSARNSIGTSNLPGLPTLSGYSSSTSGQGSFSPNRTLDFGSFSSPLTGDLQYNQNRDISNLSNYLQQQEVNRRVLSF